MADSNQNPKKCRDQMVSGTSAASIVNLVVDSWILKMANVAKEIYCIEDSDSNTAVLRLASSINLSKLIGCKFNDVGKCARLMFL